MTITMTAEAEQRPTEDVCYWRSTRLALASLVFLSLTLAV
jgi:hypothetical protein